MAADLSRPPVASMESFSALVRHNNDQVAAFAESEQYAASWRETHCSNAPPLSEQVWYRVPSTKKSLKDHVRSGVAPQVRKELWLRMAGVEDDDSVLFAKAFGQPADAVNQPKELDLSCNWPFELSRSVPALCMKPGFQEAFTRVLGTLAGAHPRVLRCPLVPVLVRVGLHFLEEWEAFALVDKLLRRRAWLDQSSREMEASRATFKWLASTKLSPMELEQVRPSGVRQQGYLDSFVGLWYTWAFHHQPFWITVRVLDMFFVEGPKVLHRLGLAALKLYAACGGKVQSSKTEEVVLCFLNGLLPETRAKWFRTAFAIPHMPWAQILRHWSSQLHAIPPDPEESTDGPSPSSLSSRPSSSSSSLSASLIADPSSEILLGPGAASLWQALWGWVPEWVMREQPTCVFRASRDGYNLRTLYRKCEHIQPVLLLVRTTEQEVFGAFIASELSERHGAHFFGSGETFLFSLLPNPKCYEWTGETDFILRGTDEELAVGSGGGAFGLWLDGELDKGSTSCCQAFNNAPLTSTGADFSCAAIEVYSLA